RGELREAVGAGARGGGGEAVGGVLAADQDPVVPEEVDRGRPEALVRAGNDPPAHLPQQFARPRRRPLAPEELGDVLLRPRLVEERKSGSEKERKKQE